MYTYIYAYMRMCSSFARLKCTAVTVALAHAVVYAYVKCKLVLPV